MVSLGINPQLQRYAVELEVERGNIPAALRRWHRVAETLGQSPRWQVELAQLLLLKGDRERAIASLDAAWYIGLDKETGSIETGKIADLVVLNANPLEDIRNTVDIQYVMKHGRLYDDDTLDEVWPDPDSYGPPPWVSKNP